MEQTWGNTGHDLILTSQTGVVLKYTRLDQITADIDDARVYGGIHFRFDQEAGALQGLWIGTHLLTHQLRELPAAQR